MPIDNIEVIRYVLTIFVALITMLASSFTFAFVCVSFYAYKQGEYLELVFSIPVTLLFLFTTLFGACASYWIYTK